MRFGLLLSEYEDLGPELHCLLKVKEDFLSYTPISPKIILVPIVPDQYFKLIGRISAKQSGTCGQSRTITWEGLERSGAIASVLRESGTKIVIGYCFQTCSKTVADQNPSAAGRLGRPTIL